MAIGGVGLCPQDPAHSRDSVGVKYKGKNNNSTAAQPPSAGLVSHTRCRRWPLAPALVIGQEPQAQSGHGWGCRSQATGQQGRGAVCEAHQELSRRWSTDNLKKPLWVSEFMLSPLWN